MTTLVITADDFGISATFNQAILDLIDEHIITAVSVIMRDCEQFPQQNNSLLSKEHVSLGLHFEYHGDDSYSSIMDALERQWDHFISVFNKPPVFINKHNWEQSETEIQVLCTFVAKKDCYLRLHQRSALFPYFQNHYADTVHIPDRMYNVTSKSFGIAMLREDLPHFPSNSSALFEIVSHPGYEDPAYDPQRNGTELNARREKDYRELLDIKVLLDSYGIRPQPFPRTKENI